MMNLTEMFSLGICQITILCVLIFTSSSINKFKVFGAVFCVLINLSFFIVVIFWMIYDLATKKYKLAKLRKKTIKSKKIGSLQPKK